MSAQRVLVLGAAGQLGQACMDCAPETVAAEGFSRATCDVTDDSALRRVMDEVDPHVVINAAAYTAVDAAEDDHESADAVNANAPAMLGALCARRVCDWCISPLTLFLMAVRIGLMPLPQIPHPWVFMAQASGEASRPCSPVERAMPWCVPAGSIALTVVILC